MSNHNTMQVQDGNDLIDWADWWASQEQATDGGQLPAVSQFSADDLAALERINNALERVAA